MSATGYPRNWWKIFADMQGCSKFLFWASLQCRQKRYIPACTPGLHLKFLRSHFFHSQAIRYHFLFCKYNRKILSLAVWFVAITSLRRPFIGIKLWITESKKIYPQLFFIYICTTIWHKLASLEQYFLSHSLE